MIDPLPFSRRVGDLGFVEGDAIELCCYVEYTRTLSYICIYIHGLTRDTYTHVYQITLDPLLPLL